MRERQAGRLLRDGEGHEETKVETQTEETKTSLVNEEGKSEETKTEETKT